jgi:hypothetical protein
LWVYHTGIFASRRNDKKNLTLEIKWIYNRQLFQYTSIYVGDKMTFLKLSLITSILLGISGLMSCSIIESQFADFEAPDTLTQETECSDDYFYEQRQKLLPGYYRGSVLPMDPNLRTECVSDGS